jgi:Uncharacterized protein conserved in bacteria
MDLFSVSVNIPDEFADTLMSSLNEIITPVYPNYDMAFTILKVVGTWRPLEGSDPYDGDIGVITTAKETRIEFPVAENDLRKVIRRIVDIHPYEEPAILITPILDWKQFIDP